MEIQLWKDILNPYELAVEELLVKFNHLIKEYQDRGMYSPMEQVCGRVKSISSILDKAQKKNIEVDKIEEQLDDIAGIRIICQFVEDIEKVADLIRNRSDMQVVTEKDWILAVEPEISYYSCLMFFHLIRYMGTILMQQV